MNVQDRQTTVVPAEAVIQETSLDNFKRMMAAFAGLNSDNVEAVSRDLQKLGLGQVAEENSMLSTNKRLRYADDAPMIEADADEAPLSTLRNMESQAQPNAYLNKEFVRVLASAVAEILQPHQSFQVVDQVCKAAEVQPKAGGPEEETEDH